jgi:TetR/AcrR family transcriptional repressor of nem operon
MGRPKQFEVDEAIGQCLGSFWEQGYANTSIDDLIRATSLTRASLYNAFTDKRGIFLRCLTAYKEQVLKPLLKPLEKSDVGPFDAVEQFFVAAVAGRSQEARRRGCFLINTLMEVTKASEPEIFAAATSGIALVEKAFLTCLTQERPNHQALPLAAARPTVQLLMCNLHGLRVLGKRGMKPQESLDLIQSALAGAKAITAVLTKPGGSASDLVKFSGL